MPPQRVKGVGLTWIRRGFAYWALRAVLVGVRLFIVLLMAILVGAGLEAVLSYSLTGTERIALYIGTGILFLGGAVFGAREAHAMNTSDLTPEERRAAAREARRRNWLFRVPFLMNFLIIALLPLVAPVLLGFASTALLGGALGRELPDERWARRDLEQHSRPQQS